MKVRTVVEVTVIEMHTGEAEPVPVATTYQDRAPSQFWPHELRIKYYEDGRWFVDVSGPTIKKDDTTGRGHGRRSWTGSDLTQLPAWIAALVTTHRPNTPTGAPE